jgi:hypothetical protein
VVRKDRPAVDGPGTVLRQRSEAGDEVRAVRVLPEDDASLESPRTMTWWRVCGASKRAWRGMARATLAHLFYLATSRISASRISGL